MGKNDKKKNILIIEDEISLAGVLKTKLEKEGYVVDLAEDGKEGYKKIKEGNPDLVLLDIVMPVMDGYEVLEQMREDNIQIPVIIISNSGQPVELEKTKSLGAVDHLIKTQFEPKEVIDKVMDYLNEERREKENKKEDKDTEQREWSGKTHSKKNNNVKILVVEDDPFLRDLITRELAKEGFAVYEAVDGEKALARLGNLNPDIILLDIILPAIDGFEVLEKIRGHEDKNINKVPVLMLSNLGEKDDIKKAKELGADDYMVKAHFTAKEITKKIKKTLNID
ncbi:MAG: response regulator transcription factor [Patescibacteria group bacterium]